MPFLTNWPLKKRVNKDKEFISTSPSSTQHTFPDSVPVNVSIQSLQRNCMHTRPKNTLTDDFLLCSTCSYLTEQGQTWNSLSVHSHSSLVNRLRNTLPSLSFSWRISSNSSMVNHTYLSYTSQCDGEEEITELSKADRGGRGKWEVDEAGTENKAEIRNHIPDYEVETSF